jgi:hypothetical protein
MIDRNHWVTADQSGLWDNEMVEQTIPALQPYESFASRPVP